MILKFSLVDVLCVFIIEIILYDIILLKRSQSCYLLIIIHVTWL